MIRTVISDLGKVILWFDNGIFLKKLGARCSRSVEEIRAAAHTRVNLIGDFDQGLISPNDFYRSIVTPLGAQISVPDFFKIYEDIFSLIPGTLDVLKKVKAAGYRLILLSNVDVRRFGHIRRKFPEIFIFDDYVLSYEIKSVKPQPRIYEEAVRRANAAAEECVFFDDIEEFVQAARTIGIESFRFTPETDLEAELKSLGLAFC